MVPDPMTPAPELELPGLDCQTVRVTTAWLDTLHLEFTLECVKAPILLALILRWGDRGEQCRIHRSNADFQARIRLSFFSYPGESDKVEVRLFQRQGHMINDGPRLLLQDQALRENPRNFVKVLVDSTKELYTGSVSRLAERRRPDHHEERHPRHPRAVEITARHSRGAPISIPVPRKRLAARLPLIFTARLPACRGARLASSAALCRRRGGKYFQR
jgi:hypothetical protein